MIILHMFLLLCIISVNAQFEVPDAKVEALYPKGFRVSIPDQDGISLFAFHGKINEQFSDRDAGTYSADVRKAKDGKWTFSDSYATLKPGDKIYYWTYVDYFDGKKKLGYPRDDQVFVVKEFIDKFTGEPVNPSDPPAATNGVNNGPSCSTTVKGVAFCRGKLIFEESFSSDISTGNWTKEVKFATSPDYEFTLYSDNSKAIFVKDGHLFIKPILTEDIYGNGFCTNFNGLDLGNSCTGIRESPECTQKPDGRFILPPTISGQISTAKKFSFKFGKIEIKAKLPKGNWIYPELYLNSEKEEYGPSYDSGQIRIAFVAGNKKSSTKLKAGVILGQSSSAREVGMRSKNSFKPWTDDFHKFQVEWSPDKITASVDGELIGNIFPPADGFAALGPQWPAANKWKASSKMAPFDREMHFTIGVGVGGHNFEDPFDEPKPWMNDEALAQKKFYKNMKGWKSTWNEESVLKVDYIKVWAI